MVDSVFLDVIRVVPQLLLVVLVVIVAVLIGKDILNGMRRPFLKPDQWQALPLTEVKKTTHNTRLFRFALPHADQQLGLPAGQHITLKVTGPHGDEILRCAPGLVEEVDDTFPAMLLWGRPRPPREQRHFIACLDSARS